jgi:Holliday junction resolvase
MPHPSKRKGNRYERELVREAEDAGVFAQRAFASNGRALGEAEAVDVALGDQGVWTVQAKRRKRIAKYLTPPEGCDVVAIREDRGESLVVLPYRRFLQLIAERDGPPSPER